MYIFSPPPLLKIQLFDFTITTKLQAMMTQKQLQSLQEITYEKIIQRIDEVEKYRHLLWYNLFSIPNAHPAVNDHVIQMRLQMKSLVKRDRIFEFVEMELQHVAALNRPLPAEELYLYAFIPNIHTKIVFQMMKKYMSNFSEKAVALFEKFRVEFLLLSRQLDDESKLALVTQLLEWTKDDPKSSEKMAKFLNEYIIAGIIDNANSTKNADLLFKILQIMPPFSSNNIFKMSKRAFFVNEIRFLPFFIHAIKVCYTLLFLCHYFSFMFVVGIRMNYLQKQDKNIGVPYFQVGYILKTRIVDNDLDWDTFVSICGRASTEKLFKQWQASFTDKLHMLSISSMPMTLKERIIRSITQKWTVKYCREKETIGLDAAERSECIKVVRMWVDIESQHKLANTLIDQLLDDFNAFHQRDPNESMNFVSSEEGLELFQLTFYIYIFILSINHFNIYIYFFLNSFLQQISQKIKVGVFDYFCHWFEQLCGNVAKSNVSVATMDMLLTNARLEKLLKLWEGMVIRNATIDINTVRDLAKKYEQVKANRELLETFFKRSGIGIMWFGNELQKLHELSLQMTTTHDWQHITLQQALTFEWTIL
ncbi:hypothetical protein RFI_30092 [Reticulomyxa filosa]|uniref:Uncharacterized protein n=1 Tax=Reticulomyxa filosa TaxID=46433 RepID=X6M085_RETFI|nr:hypothetical protein RFI_30092 [Reticulomyxa filosa]|eukprot:ETO07299.1 hypothetical protein RFI_30092 [Reticulomyxa filosa]